MLYIEQHSRGDYTMGNKEIQQSNVVNLPSEPTIRQLKCRERYYFTNEQFDSLCEKAQRHVIPRAYDTNASKKRGGAVCTFTKAPGRLRRDDDSLIKKISEIRTYRGWQNRLSDEYPENMTDEQRCKFNKEAELIRSHAKDWAFGFLLGENYVAIDCDLEDKDKSEQVLDIAQQEFGDKCPIRSRGGTRWGIIVQVVDDDAEKYETTELSVKCEGGHDVEIFTQKKYLVISGKHPEGGEYVWYGGTFADIQKIKMEQLLSFREKVESRFGVQKSNPFSLSKRRIAQEFRGNPLDLKSFCGEDKDFDSLYKSFLNSQYVRDVRADYLRESEWFVDEDEEKIYIRCMNEDEHSDHTGDKQTCYFKESGGFKCFHSHCENITREQFEAYYFEKAPRTTLEQLVNDCTKCAVIKNGKDHRWLSHFTPSTQSVSIVIHDASLIGFEVRFDTFTTKNYIRFTDKDKYARFYIALNLDEGRLDEWQAVELDRMEIPLRTHLGSLGFVDGRFEYIKVLASVAKQHTFDSMVEKVNALPEWDGVKRIDTFFQDYLTDVDAVEGQTADYLKVASRYFWTSLVGRATCTQPEGVKVDTSLVLVGKQGFGKGTLSDVIALGHFTDSFSFNMADKEQRQLLHDSGAVVVEVGEMAGWSKKDVESIKSFLSARVDIYRGAYERSNASHPRRNIFIMTTNTDDFCRDETGNRRFLPVKVTKTIDVETLKQEVGQLWAEARVLFNENGVMWEGVNEMTRVVNENFEDDDPWYNAIAVMLPQLGDRFKTEDVFRKAIQKDFSSGVESLDKVKSNRIGKVLRRLGYTRKKVSINNIKHWVWVKTE